MSEPPCRVGWAAEHGAGGSDKKGEVGRQLVGKADRAEDQNYFPGHPKQ